MYSYIFDGYLSIVSRLFLYNTFSLRLSVENHSLLDNLSFLISSLISSAVSIMQGVRLHVGINLRGDSRHHSKTKIKNNDIAVEALFVSYKRYNKDMPKSRQSACTAARAAG